MQIVRSQSPIEAARALVASGQRRLELAARARDPLTAIIAISEARLAMQLGRRLAASAQEDSGAQLDLRA